MPSLMMRAVIATLTQTRSLAKRGMKFLKAVLRASVKVPTTLQRDFIYSEIYLTDGLGSWSFSPSTHRDIQFDRPYRRAPQNSASPLFLLLSTPVSLIDLEW